MNLVAQLKQKAVNEPKPPSYSSITNQSAHKNQLTRILIHLRDQLHRTNPELPMPSQWVLGMLVDNAMTEKAAIENATKQLAIDPNETQDWQSEVIALLKIIRDACDSKADQPCAFVHKDGSKPLFPNHELFDEWDTYRFSQVTLDYLEEL